MNPASKAGLVLGSCTLVAITLIVTTHALTRERINNVQHALQQQSLMEVLPEGPFDTDPLTSIRYVTESALGVQSPQPLYTVYRNNKPLAAALTVVAPDGYNGKIHMLLGINFEGVITGVRVTQHRETPGLGDDIELKHSQWIKSFNAQSLGASTAGDWQTSNRGGQFDSFTGATVTPAAVIHAIYRALQWYEQNRISVFTT